MAARILEEFKEIHDESNKSNNNCGITIGLVNDDSYYDWKITLVGPKDTCYKGGCFILRAHFPDDYPNKPPEVNFITPIYHVNVKPTAPKSKGEESLGHICISTLNWWQPQYRMREVLLNIYSLFYMHNPDSAYDIKRAKEYNEDEGIYLNKAQHFTKKYATFQNNYINYDRTQDWDFTL